jgi:hypothetical protein
MKGQAMHASPELQAIDTDVKNETAGLAGLETHRQPLAKWRKLTDTYVWSHSGITRGEIIVTDEPGHTHRFWFTCTATKFHKMAKFILTALASLDIKYDQIFDTIRRDGKISLNIFIKSQILL